MCGCTVVQLEKFSSLMSLFLKFFQVVMFIFSLSLIHHVQ